MEVNADYLRKLSTEGSKANKKVNEILEDLVEVAKKGVTSTDIYIIEEYEGLYESDIKTIKQSLLEKGFDISTKSSWDNEDMTAIWRIDISW